MIICEKFRIVGAAVKKDTAKSAVQAKAVSWH